MPCHLGGIRRMKIVSTLCALVCCGATCSLAFGPALAGLSALAAALFTALAGYLALGALYLPEMLALLGAFIVFAASTRQSEDV